MEAWRDFGDISAYSWMDGFGNSDDGGRGWCWRMSWINDDGAWTIGSGLGFRSHRLKFGLGFFILIKLFLVSVNLSDRLNLSVSLMLVYRIATSKIMIFYVT
jgi:hypothetical protein